MLEKVPGADILYDVRASRAVPDTVEQLGGRALINRVGHAFFKTRMRDEGGEFGGEVSGHYYFKAFYNADSGTIPALLILELLSKRDTTLAELLREYRSTYFISGEINSTVADQQAKMDEIKALHADATITELDGISVDYEDWHFNVRPSNTEPLLRLNLESLVSQAGHGSQARRDARADPRVIHGVSIPTPFRVGDVNAYLVEDDPLTLFDVGPNSGALARRAGGRAGDARPPGRGARADRHHPPARRPPRAGGRARRPLGRDGLRAGRARARWWRTSRATRERNDEFAQALLRRHGVPDQVVTALGAVTRGYRGWGASAPVTRGRCTTAASWRSPSRTFAVHHRPGHSPTDTVFFDAANGDLIAGDHLLRNISSNPLIALPPADGPADGAPARAEDYMASMRADARDAAPARCSRATATPFTGHAALIDERFAMHERRAASSPR